MSPYDIRYYCTSILLITHGISSLPHVRYAVFLLTAAQFNPIFITGFPRSGTTMVAAILDRHSAIAISPETHFFEALKLVQDTPATAPVLNLVERLLDTPRIGDLGLTPTDVYSFMGASAHTPRNIFQAILSAYQYRMGKTMIGEKTPCHLMKAHKLLTWYPDAKMIFVVRDGRDAVASLLKMTWRGHGMARLHAFAWHRHVQLAQRLKRQFPDRFIFVKYEDILSHPEEQVLRLDHFCGVPFELPQVNASIPTHVVPRWEEPWKFLATRPFDLSRVGQWLTQFTPEEKWALNHTMSPYLKLFGYQDHDLSHCPISRRIWLAATGLLLRTGETRRLYRAAFNHFGGQSKREHHPLPAPPPVETTPREAELIT